MADPTDKYLALITSEHAGAPKFAQVVRAVTGGPAAVTDALLGLPAAFDLDTAVKAQLDVIGLWVGISRTVKVPLTGVYFAWDDADADGWDRGVWQGPFDPDTGPYQVDDVTYRTMIRAKIAANMWDGTYEGMRAFFDFAFGPGVVVPQDNQDMSITLLYDDLRMNAVMVSLLTQGAYPLKPMGVRLIFQAASGAPIFAWDLNTPRYQGWTGSSVWI